MTWAREVTQPFKARLTAKKYTEIKDFKDQIPILIFLKK